MEIDMNVWNFQRINHTMKAMANLVNRSARDMVGVSARRMGILILYLTVKLMVSIPFNLTILVNLFQYSKWLLGWATSNIFCQFNFSLKILGSYDVF
jgi:hypothetical protein